LKNLITRTLAGAVFVALIIGSIFWHPLAVLVVFFFFNALALWEFSRLFKNKGYFLPSSSLIFLGSIVYLTIAAFANSYIDVYSLLIIVPLILIFFISSLFQKSNQVFEELALKVLGIIYISIPFGLFNLVENLGITGQSTNEPLLLVMFFIIVWANDTFAYLFGSAFGKHRLFERISPKKSWEGSIGGGLSAMLIAGLFAYYTSIFDISIWMILAFVIVVTATLGDLVESLLKRQVGVKDSGNIMPGHGGILDRFDAAIFAIPFYVALLYLLA
jgi:phosphatidate cytidylyltransferase